MVRAVGSAALALALALVLAPSPALAEGTDTADSPHTEAIDYSGKLDLLSTEVSELLTEEVKSNQEIRDSLEKLLPDEQEVPSDEPTDTDYLKSIDEKLSDVIASGEEPEIQVQQTMLAASSLSFSSWSNVSPTGAYATYAAGMLPRVGFGQHYVFMQDSSSSYVFIWGDLAYDGQFFTGDADYVRWYYAGQGTGYVMESGSGSVTAAAGSYVVMSDLGGYPLLDAQGDLLRKEVTYYAMVALCVFSLAHVWLFCIRMRTAVTQP